MNLRNTVRATRQRPTRMTWVALTAAAAALALAACGPTGSSTAHSSGTTAAASSNAPDPQASSDPVSASPSVMTSTPAKSPSAKPKPPANSGGTHGGSGSGSGAPGGSAGAAANAPQAVRAAFAQAKADGKNVLLDFGATWCPACRTVLSLYTLPSVQAELSAHYHLVKIDISNNDHTNMALLGQYDKGPSYGLPVMIVATPNGSTLVDTNKTGHPKLNETGLLNWLKEWSK